MKKINEGALSSNLDHTIWKWNFKKNQFFKNRIFHYKDCKNIFFAVALKIATIPAVCRFCGFGVYSIKETNFYDNEMVKKSCETNEVQLQSSCRYQRDWWPIIFLSISLLVVLLVVYFDFQSFYFFYIYFTKANVFWNSKTTSGASASSRRTGWYPPRRTASRVSIQRCSWESRWRSAKRSWSTRRRKRYLTMRFLTSIHYLVILSLYILSWLYFELWRLEAEANHKVCVINK